MRCNGRGLKPQFAPKEQLFHRVNKLQCQVLTGNGLLLNMRVLDMSVNRQGDDGQPNDVIIGFPRWGIIRFDVDSVPSPYVVPDRNTPRSIQFAVEHDPICKVDDQNYYHCEIRAFASDRTRLTKLPDGAKKWFRAELAKVASLERPPEE